MTDNADRSGRHPVVCSPFASGSSTRATQSWWRRTSWVARSGGSSHVDQPTRRCSTRTELATIDAVLDDLAGLTATQVSTLSHEEAAWRHTGDGDTIPYELALVPREQIVTPTARRIGAEVAARYHLADAR